MCTKTEQSLRCVLFLKRYLLVYFWLCWVFVAARAFSLVVECGGCSLVVMCGLLISEHRL